MRLAAQLRGGYYPAPLAAVAHMATYLRPPERGPCCLFDPCAGEGAAIQQLADLLGCPLPAIYAIELDDSRAEILRAALTEAHVLAPASIFGCRASLHSFPFVWLNPPFDDAYGGQRTEVQFLRVATDWVMPGGVMALVCPEDVADDFSEVRRHFMTYYTHCSIVPFPKRHRRFNEVVIFGHKRLRPHADRTGPRSWPAVQAPEGFLYHIPAGPGPRHIQKVEPTEPELQRLLAGSPLRAHLNLPPAPGMARPPLALCTGHVALLLASGHLDGLVRPEGEPPHVVRGTACKREYVADVTDTVNDDGSTTTRTTLAEKIELVVRTVNITGAIRNFQETAMPEHLPARSSPVNSSWLPLIGGGKHVNHSETGTA